MRRSAAMRLAGLPAVFALAPMALLSLCGLGSGCVRPPPCDGVACAAACPRDATVDAAGRCACGDGAIALLGACVPPPVADAYCGKAARPDPRGAGCAFRTCEAGEMLDVVTGSCTLRASLPHGGATSCPEGAAPVALAGHGSCALPEAVCPRGARPGAGGARCMAPPVCPPGALPEGDGCRPVVTSGGRSGRRVDLGAWATLALGIDGGAGAAALCQPLASRPDVFVGDRDTEVASPAVRVDIALLVPDEDISRVHAQVHAELLDRSSPSSPSSRGGAGPGDGPISGPPRALNAAAEALVSETVSSSVELLRGLGGEASSAAVELEVTCAIAP